MQILILFKCICIPYVEKLNSLLIYNRDWYHDMSSLPFQALVLNKDLKAPTFSGNIFILNIKGALNPAALK